MDQKVFMVSAATKGIWRAVLERAIQDGYFVAASGRNSEVLAEMKDRFQDQIRVSRVDVTSESDLDHWVQDTLKEKGRIDAVVTNTGGPHAGRVGQITDEMWRGGLESTLLLATRMYQLTKDALVKSQGSMTHITSLVANRPNEVLAISSTLRAGMKALTELQALEMAPFRVRVNAVLPGHTWTDRQKHLIEIRAKEQGISVEEYRRNAEKEIPMLRFAEASEIASVVSFLSSKDASYVTGVSLVVDGGANLK